MKIPLSLARVKSGQFKNEETQQTITFAYVYALGDFQSLQREGNSDVGLSMQKLKVDTSMGLGLANAISQKVSENKEKLPFTIHLECQLVAAEGKPSSLVVVGL